MAPTAKDWLARLYPQLQSRAATLKEHEAYYCGDHPLPFLTPAHAEKMRSSFRQMLAESQSNFMRLIVDVVEERLQVDGFRLSANSDMTADKDAWDIWQANQMDSLSRSAFVDALIKGVSYISVWPGEDYADIAVEDATETIVAYTPGTNFRRRDAALKIWKDDWAKLERANIYLPDGIYKFQRKAEGDDAGTPQSRLIATSDDRAWEELKPEFGDQFVPNPLGVVPIIPLRNRGRLLVEGESELKDSTKIQQQINGFLFLLALGGYFGAHKQRYATGVTLFEDEIDKKLKLPWDIAIDKMVVDENPEAKFGEWSQTDLSGYLAAIEQKVAHLAITTRTPKHYLLPEGQNPSGDAIKSSESGLVRKIERKQASFGEALEEVMALARRAQGDSETPVDSEIVWQDPSTESEAVRTDAIIKQFKEKLIPQEVALEQLGYTQTQISRMIRARASDALIEALNPPVPPPAVNPDGTPVPPTPPTP